MQSLKSYIDFTRLTNIFSKSIHVFSSKSLWYDGISETCRFMGITCVSPVLSNGKDRNNVKTGGHSWIIIHELLLGLPWNSKSVRAITASKDQLSLENNKLKNWNVSVTWELSLKLPHRHPVNYFDTFYCRTIQTFRMDWLTRNQLSRTSVAS